jgi:ATP-dependent helicase YprA (DUF1998 family)
LAQEPVGYLYDAEPGGAGICELLLDPADRFRHFRTAIEVVEGLVDCSCADGCPICLFQYGCDLRNQPRSLSRIGLGHLLAMGLELREADA